MQTNHRTQQDSQTFARLLRFWRQVHSLSQEQLAERMDCSPRHISRLETGYSKPSETLILDLAIALKLGRRDTNHLLLAAGFAPTRSQADFLSQEFRWLRKAMALTLSAHDPHPSALLDSSGNILMVNRAWSGFFAAIAGTEAMRNAKNHYGFLFNRNGAGMALEEWEDALSVILMSMTQHYLFTNSASDRQMVEQLKANATPPDDWQQRAAELEPMTSFRLRIRTNQGSQDFYSVMSNVGAMGPAEYQSEPNLSIHTLYPADSSFNLAPYVHNAVGHPLQYDRCEDIVEQLAQSA